MAVLELAAKLTNKVLTCGGPRHVSTYLLARCQVHRAQRDATATAETTYIPSCDMPFQPLSTKTRATANNSCSVSNKTADRYATAVYKRDIFIRVTCKIPLELLTDKLMKRSYYEQALMRISTLALGPRLLHLSEGEIRNSVLSIGNR